MKRTTRIILFAIIICSWLPNEAKKIKNFFKIEKENKFPQNSSSEEEFSGIKFSFLSEGTADSIITFKDKIAFSGFEKEVNSSKETFLISNKSLEVILGLEIRIEYLDLQDRMLHSRDIKEKCYVPAGETRKIDISSWDKQHTYYYYLGNEPRKVATPFKVRIIPLSLWVEEKDNI